MKTFFNYFKNLILLFLFLGIPAVSYAGARAKTDCVQAFEKEVKARSAAKKIKELEFGREIIGKDIIDQLRLTDKQILVVRQAYLRDRRGLVKIRVLRKRLSDQQIEILIDERIIRPKDVHFGKDIAERYLNRKISYEQAVAVTYATFDKRDQTKINRLKNQGFPQIEIQALLEARVLDIGETTFIMDVTARDLKRRLRVAEALAIIEARDKNLSVWKVIEIIRARFNSRDQARILISGILDNKTLDRGSSVGSRSLDRKLTIEEAALIGSFESLKQGDLLKIQKLRKIGFTYTEIDLLSDGYTVLPEIASARKLGKKSLKRRLSLNEAIAVIRVRKITEQAEQIKQLKKAGFSGAAIDQLIRGGLSASIY